MAGGYVIPTAGWDALVAELNDARKRLSELERPTGSQTAQALKQLQDLVAGLINPTSLSTTGDVNAGGNVNVTGYVFTPAGYAFDITYTRRGAWLGNDGRLGWASSSITAKELLDSIAEPDAEMILSITSHHYERKAELAKRDDPKAPTYVGPGYHVAIEWGAIAEELHTLGLWQVVIYDWTIKYQLAEVLDADGNQILDADGLVLKERVGSGERVGEGVPVGIHYELLGLLSIIATRHVWKAHQALAARVAALEGA
ncbi:MAG: hypothetical protein ABIP33_06500 [Pseudolysinimonas sp.]